MEILKDYVPTSKAQLIQMAMFVNNGDLEKAQEMFDFYNKNLQLPDFDPVSPSIMQQMKGGISDMFAWIKENQNDLLQGYQFVQSVIKNKGVVPTIMPTDVPTSEPLPPINE